MKPSTIRLTLPLLALIWGCNALHRPAKLPLSLKGFLDHVRSNHPISQQSRLLNQRGEQQIKMARGQFDPKFKTSLDLKNYKDKEYFNILKSKVSIPTWVNADLDIIYERNQGIYLNPERNVPDEGLLYTRSLSTRRSWAIHRCQTDRAQAVPAR